MKGNPYTRSDLELVVAAYNAGRSSEEIAQALNRTPNAIRNLIYRLRLEPRLDEFGLGGLKNHVFTPEEDEQLLQLRAEGYKDKQIACIMGLPREAVASHTTYLRRKYGNDAVPFKRRPYTSKEVQIALEMWRAGAGRYEIAKALNRDAVGVTCYITYLRKIYGEEVVPRRRGKGGKT